MELVQFGASWCRPCLVAKDYILKNYNVNEFNYTFIDLDKAGELDSKHTLLLAKVNPKSIPAFVCVDEDEIVLEFYGFDKEMIDKCISYMLNESLDKNTILVEEPLTTEMFERMQQLEQDMKTMFDQTYEDPDENYD